MRAQTGSSSSFAAKTAKLSALALLFYGASSFAQQVGQAAFNRGMSYQAQLISGGIAGAQYRTHLISEVVTRPTIVQAPIGTTVVLGSTAVNTRTISGGAYAAAAQLEVRCPLAGGRVVMYGNRAYNLGRIVGHTESTQIMTECEESFIGTVMSSRNLIVNNGRIQAIN